MKNISPALIPLLKALVIFGVINLVFILICSAVLVCYDINPAAISLFTLIFLLISSFAGSFCYGFLVRTKGILRGMIFALPVIMILLIAGFEIPVSAAWLTKLISVVIISIIGGICGVNKRIKT